MNVDEARDSARTWVGELTGKSGDALDDLMEEGAQEGARVEREESAPLSLRDRAMLQNGRLTAVQVRVLDLAGNGCPVRDIAGALEVSRSTADRYLIVARYVLGARNTTHAVRLAIRQGQLEP